jgi:RimJ/RimL family protein N-acetyltransferase
VSGRPGEPEVRLRAADRADADRLLDWLDDPQIARWLLAPEYWRAVAEAHPDPPAEGPPPHAVYAIEVADQGAVGVGILVAAHGFGPEPELGIVIGRRDLWGRGIGAAAVRGMLAAAVERGWRAVRLTTLADNERALRCYRTCGFEITATEPYRRGAELVEVAQMRVALPLIRP